MKATPTQRPEPIIIKRNRVPRITLIKRPAARAALHAGFWFFAGVCTAMFVALLALVIVKFGWFR